MRLYFVDSQWLDYDTIHNNYGYTKTPTEDISSFRDTQEETWGELLEGITGFYSDLEVVHYYRGTYFVQNYTGWHTLNELCYQCNLMPSEAETEGLTFTNGTELSKAARLLVNPFPGTDVESYKYLVQKRLDLGWLTEDRLREYGWSKYNPEPPVVDTSDYYILDATTGAVLHSVNSPLSSAKPSAVTITGNIEHIDNPPTPPTPQNEILLGLFYRDGWQSKPFSSNDYWYSGVVNSSDVDYLRSIGLGLTTISDTYGSNGCIYYQTGYSFELIGLYSDLGETPVSYDPANFYISYRNIANENIFTINNYSAFSTLVKTYKVIITKNS